jgi:hypothetical protein
MKFKINKVSESPELMQCCNRLVKEIIQKGHEETGSDQSTDFVLNLIDLDHPKAYRRRTEEEKVVSLALTRETRNDMKSICYESLVKSLSNMMFCIVMPEDRHEMKCCSVTPEVGFMEFIYSPEKIFFYMYPVISSHFVLRNRISEDLDLEENQRIPEIDDMIFHARILKSLGALPAPFPITEFLDQETIDQLYRLYQIRGLSYGNLSIRNYSYKSESTSFWMTARGVDKSRLKGIGKDILPVNGFDTECNEMLVSVPREHVHAWMDGIPCTMQVSPCGTRELAENVVDLLRTSPSPERAVAGLKNHGITITGPDIKDIFERIKGNLIVNIPMFD